MNVNNLDLNNDEGKLLMASLVILTQSKFIFKGIKVNGTTKIKGV